MRTMLLGCLLCSTICCTTPSVAPKPGRTVVFQPSPAHLPKVHPGTKSPVKTVVGLVVDSEGLVQSVIPIEGPEPFLAGTIKYAQEWRFSKTFPATSESPVILTLTFHGNTVSIDIKL